MFIVTDYAALNIFEFDLMLQSGIFIVIYTIPKHCAKYEHPQSYNDKGIRVMVSSIFDFNL